MSDPRKSRTQRTISVLAYEDIENAQGLLVRAFGLEPGPFDRGPGGEIVHGEVYVDDEAIWLHQTNPEFGLRASTSLRGANSITLVIVDDVDAHCERARSAGAEITYEPADRPYGLREYGARDPEGGHWSFATPLT